jgi:hypothetical protein
VNLRWPLSPFLRPGADEEAIVHHHDIEAAVTDLVEVLVAEVAAMGVGMEMATAETATAATRGNFRVTTEIRRLRITLVVAAVAGTAAVDLIPGVDIPAIKLPS